MKKILLTIFAFIYFGLAVRATVHLHDCIDIFSGSPDTHATPLEKNPCTGDPKQCNFETEQRINEAASKSYRVLDQVFSPLFNTYRSPRLYITPRQDWNQEKRFQRKCISLFIIHRVIRR